MGGRGSKLNVETYLGWGHERRIGEYEAIDVLNDTKYLVQKNGGPVSAPLFSNTQNRIYVTLNAQGKISAITKYGSDHRELFTIHESHATEKKKGVHAHVGYGKDRIRIEWGDMTSEQKNLYKTIKESIQNRDIVNKAKGWYASHGD